MKIETKWNLGNFALTLSSTVSDQMRDALASFGLRFLGQRVSKVDHILGGYTKKDGKEVRKAGWRRTDAAFSTDVAAKLALAFSELAIPDSEAKLPAQAVLTEYVPTAAEPKFKDEKVIASRHESANDLEEWLADKVGFEGDTHGTDGEFSLEMLSAIRTYKLEQLKNL
jgi:hypothetical protein